MSSRRCASCEACCLLTMSCKQVIWRFTMMCPVKHTAGKPDSNCNICQSECNTHTETKHMIIYIREAVLCPCTTESNADYMYTVCFSQGTAMTSKLATYRQCFVIMLLHVIIVVNVQFLQYRLPVH